MDKETRVQILDGAICISHIANTFIKRYDSNYILSSYEEMEKQILLWQPV